MNRISKFLLLTTALTGLLAADANAADAPAKLTIKEIMKKGHKGDDAMSKHVTQGKGTQEEIKQLLGYYRVLATLEPKKGDLTEWKTRTAKLVKAAESLDKSEPGALDGFKAAVNCKACHDAHKEKN